MFSRVFFCIIASFFCFSKIFAQNETTQTTIEAALEIGSGTIRFCIATIVREDGSVSIKEILFEKSNEVLFANNAAANDNILDETIFQEALHTLKIFKDTAAENKVLKIHGIATDIFRKAKNGREFIENLSHELDWEIKIINQNKEGRLGFLTIAHIVGLYNPPINHDQLVAWDAGNSSAQLTILNQKGEFIVYQSPFGLTPIRKILQKIRDNNKNQSILDNSPAIDTLTTNPVLKEELDELINYLIENSLDIPSAIADTIRDGVVVRKFNGGMLQHLFHADHERLLTKTEIMAEIERCANKTDIEIEQMYGSTEIEAESLILKLVSLYFLMEKFDIPWIRFAKLTSGNSYGIFLDSLDSSNRKE